MFERAMRAVFTAALDPVRASPGAGDIRCCDLCLRRYPMLALDGALGALPHDLAHVGVLAVDEVVRTRVREVADGLLAEPWTSRLSEADRRAEVERRVRATTLALLAIANEQLAEVVPLVEDLRQERPGPARARRPRAVPA